MEDACESKPRHQLCHPPHANPVNVEEDDDDSAVDGPFVLAHVTLVKHSCKWLQFALFSL
jgi:hypothetical protein